MIVRTQEEHPIDDSKFRKIIIQFELFGKGRKKSIVGMVYASLAGLRTSSRGAISAYGRMPSPAFASQPVREAGMGAKGALTEVRSLEIGRNHGDYVFAALRRNRMIH